MPRSRRALGLALGAVVVAFAAILFLRESAVPPPEAGDPDAATALDVPAPLAPGAPALPPSAPEDVTLFAPGIGNPPPAAPPAAPREPEPAGPVQGGAESKGPFAGIVVDKDGKPVAGAEVRIVGGWGRGGGIDATAIPPVTTAGDGRFAFTLEREVASVRVLARARGFAAARPDVEVAPERETRVVMVPAAMVRVTVVEPDGSTPVRGALVTVLCGDRAAAQDDGFVPGGLGWTDQATTDARGVAELAANGGRAAVTYARGPSGPYGRKDGLLVPPEGLDVKVALVATSTLVLTVKGPDGATLSGVQMLVVSTAGVWEGTTDASGTWRVEGVPAVAVPGPNDLLQVSTSLEGYAPGNARVPPPAPGLEGRATIALEPWRSLAGHVLRADGTPAAQATVSWASGLYVVGPGAGVHWAEDVTADAQGRFRFVRFAAGGERTITAQLAVADGVEFALTRLVAGEEIPEDLEIRLGPAQKGAPTERDASARIRVLAADGAAAAGVLVEAGIPTLRFEVLDRKTTDAEGRASLEGLVRGTVELVLHPPGAPSFTTRIQGVGTGAEERVVKLPGGVVTGRVTRTDGSPAAGLALRLEAIARDVAGRPTYFSGGAGTVCAADGTFRFTRVGDGEYRIVPEDPTLSWIGGPGNASYGSPGLVQAGASEVALVAVTQAESLGHLLEVEAVDGLTGRPLGEGAQMTAAIRLQEGRQHYVQLTSVPGEPGLYRTQSTLPTGVHEVTVVAVGRRPMLVRGVRVPGAGGPARIRVEFSPGTRITGHVHEESGTVPPGMVVVRVEKSEARVGADGSFVLDLTLDPGERELEVSGDYVRVLRRRVRTTADAPVDVDVSVVAGGALRCSLLDAVPSDRVALTITRVDAEAGSQAFTESVVLDRSTALSRGPSALLAGLAPGRYRVTGTWDGTALPLRDATVERGATAVVPVRPPPPSPGR